jgi:hypothetical protein
MPGGPQSLMITIPTYRQKLLHDIYKSTRCVLSFDPVKLELIPHYWHVTMASEIYWPDCFYRPVREGARVPPAELRRHREVHQYLGPGCLCPLLEPLNQEPVFREAAIYLTTFGRYEGEYVAECAKSECGYLGPSLFSPMKRAAHAPHHPVPIERIYSMYGVPLKVFPLRGQFLNLPQCHLQTWLLRRRYTLPSTSLPRTRDEACNQKAVEEDICPSWYVRLFLRERTLNTQAQI